MLVTRSTFTSQKNIDQLFSRFDSRVAKVQTLIHPILNSTIITDRPWVGKLDKSSGKFEIIQTTRFFSSRLVEANFFRLFIHGLISEKNLQSKISIELRLGIRAAIMFILVALFSLFVVINFFRSGTWVSLLVGLLPLMVMVTLLSIQINRTEKALMKLLEGKLIVEKKV